MADVKATRHFGFDFLRVLACYMVMQVHTGEFYYIGTNGLVLNTPNSHWVGIYNSLCRACVPLFVMLSGYYLFPISQASIFFKKRFTRVVTPFVVWCTLYALYYHLQGQCTAQVMGVNIAHIALNFGTEVGHLWFVYMLIGVYLFAPIIAPWIQSCSKRGMQYYLLLWALTLCVPYIHLWYPQIWGEAFWNHTPTLYYFSGFLGYVVLANYLKRFCAQASTRQVLWAVLLLLLGYAITAGGFIYRLDTEKYIMTLELTWGFETINVAMLALALFLLFKQMAQVTVPGFVSRALGSIARLSYGMYLAHIMLLNWVFGLLSKYLANAAISIPVIAFCTFLCTYVVVKILSFIPKSKWLVG